MPYDLTQVWFQSFYIILNIYYLDDTHTHTHIYSGCPKTVVYQAYTK